MRSRGSVLVLMPRTVGEMSWTSAYRARGADLPFGDPGAAHGVPFEGYYWRVVDPASGAVVVALSAVCRGLDGPWGLSTLAAHPGGFERTVITRTAASDPRGVRRERRAGAARRCRLAVGGHGPGRAAGRLAARRRRMAATGVRGDRPRARDPMAAAVLASGRARSRCARPGPRRRPRARPRRRRRLCREELGSRLSRALVVGSRRDVRRRRRLGLVRGRPDPARRRGRRADGGGRPAGPPRHRAGAARWTPRASPWLRGAGCCERAGRGYDVEIAGDADGGRSARAARPRRRRASAASRARASTWRAASRCGCDAEGACSTTAARRSQGSSSAFRSVHLRSASGQLERLGADERLEAADHGPQRLEPHRRLTIDRLDARLAAQLRPPIPGGRDPVREQHAHGARLIPGRELVGRRRAAGSRGPRSRSGRTARRRGGARPRRAR